jgi:hypothetical protein
MLKNSISASTIQQKDQQTNGGRSKIPTLATTVVLNNINKDNNYNKLKNVRMSLSSKLNLFN